MPNIDTLIRQAILDAPEWTDADRAEYRKHKNLEARFPDHEWHPLNGVPRATRLAILKAGIAAGEVPILGGLGGFDWPDLLALGLAEKSYAMTRDGDVDSVAFCYTGPGYVNVQGQFATAGKWFDEGGAMG